MAYDDARSQTVIFGGYDGWDDLDETWVWNGNAWAQKFPTTHPSARTGQAMIFDPARSEVVLFGGVYSLSDTWTWNGTTWTLKSPAKSPGGRYDHAMVYDAARGQVVLFGGSNSSTSQGLADTWIWDGTTWTKKTPPVSPPARFSHAMTYDAANGVVVLFGGYGGGKELSDTWVWDGTTWTQKAPSISPAARSSAVMAYDELNHEVVLYGGNGDSGSFRDTWIWNGSSWTQQTPIGNPPGATTAITYDATRKQVLLFGASDIWAWEGGSQCGKLSLSPYALFDGQMSMPYSEKLSVSCGTPPYTYVVSSGTLPSGLFLDGAGGVISGIPSQEETTHFTITVTDALGTSDSQSYAVSIGAELPCIFCDDFADHDFNSVLGFWTWKTGSWSAATSDAVGSTSKKTDLLSPDFTCTNCTFEAHISVQSGGRASLFAWYGDARNNIEVKFMQDKQKILIKQKHAGVAAKASANIAINANQLYEIRITFDGNTFLTSIDGVEQPLLTVNKVGTPSGGAMFRVKSTTGAPVSGTIADIWVY